MKKNQSDPTLSLKNFHQIIHFIRGHKVILDQDLAMLYGVETRRLNEQVKRNKHRFPEDFMFQLNKVELTNLMSHFATSSCENDDFSSLKSQPLKSQFVTSNWGGRRKLPQVFTEHGVLMAANVLKSKQAISVSIQIVRAFVRLREVMNSQNVLEKQCAEMKSFMLKNSQKVDQELQRIWKTIDEIMNPPYDPNGPKIGFDLS